jgi:hypothetical protein
MLIATLASTCFALGKADSVKFDPFWKSESPIIVPVAEMDGVASVQFPAMPQKKGELPVIRFKAYLRTPQFAGWSQYMHIDLNGKALGANVDAASRVLNRAPLMSTQIGSESLFKNDLILTLFAPAGTEVDPKILTDRDEGYSYLMDVSDAANRVVIGVDDRIESQGPNKLTFTNTYRKLTTGETAGCDALVIEDLEAGYIPESDVRSLRHNELLHVETASGPSISTGDAKLTAHANGALELNVAGESYFFTGAYSRPAKNGMAFNSMGTPDQSAADWKVVPSSDPNGKKLVITGSWKDYTVVRTIIPDNGRFRVRDSITNKTNGPLGMAIRYNAITNSLFTGSNVFLCGSASLTTSDNCATNPSIFIRQPKTSMGLVVEDSLFRLQMEVAKKDNSVEYSTQHFGLAPYRSYTLEWTIYPSKSTDFWNFINRVRKVWKVNYTVQGPFVFGDDRVIPGRRARLYPMNPWFGYATGQGLTLRQFTEIIRPRVKKVLAAQPDAIPIGMLETNLIPYDTRLSDRKVPQGTMNGPSEKRTGYGLELTKAQTEYIRKTPWWDSQIKTEDGRAVMDSYYSSAPYCDLMVYPAPGNYQLKYMLWQVDFLMDWIGMKGIYMDQFNLGIKLEQPGRSDYSKWDGHTVDLTPNGEIKRAYTDGTLVGAPARAEIVRHILKKGGVVIINGHQVDREVTGLPIQAFAETEWDLESPQDLLSWKEPPYMPAIAEGQLSSPISLGIRPDRFGEFGKEHWAEIIQKWVITCLKNGTVYYYYANTIPKTGPGAGDYGIINHMFPFTPVELHAGWLIGKERILTAKSGRFFWDHPTKPGVLAFDSKGYAAKPQSLKIAKKGNGWQVDLKIDDWQQTAVIHDPAEK